jgi:3-dehydroquinate synthase
MDMLNKKIEVSIKNRSYPILIGFGILTEVGNLSKELGDSCFLISQKKIFSLYGNMCRKAFEAAGISVKPSVFSDGESAKSFETYKALLEDIIQFDEPAKKRIFIANLGGGVVGDVGGFVAATYRRGIDYIQIPTTLLANVDSAVGGKCAINLCGIKNIVGSFYQPRLVVADLSLLKTLPSKELIDSMAEVVKYGVIADYHFFCFVEDNLESILSLKPSVIEHVVERCYEIKAEIVSEDELDKKGIRAILNFGHTIGHAIEGAEGFSIRHGEAVAIGMAAESSLAVYLGLLKEEERDRIKELLRRVGLPIKTEGADPKRIMDTLIHDKKFLGRVKFVLPKRIGEVELVEDIDEGLIRRVIEEMVYGR